jgi:hypothetical protein
MRVKVGDTWYDPSEIPIVLELSPVDKQRISEMSPEATKWGLFPDWMTEISTSEQLLHFMDE